MRRPRPTEVILASAPSALEPARSWPAQAAKKLPIANPLAHDGLAVLREACCRLGTGSLSSLATKSGMRMLLSLCSGSWFGMPQAHTASYWACQVS
jgi:hypothetical protein